VGGFDRSVVAHMIPVVMTCEQSGHVDLLPLQKFQNAFPVRSFQAGIYHDRPGAVGHIQGDAAIIRNDTPGIPQHMLQIRFHRYAHQLQTAPPLAKMVWPVTQLASSVARKATTDAISSGSHIRWEGERLSIAFNFSSPTARIISVST